MRAKIYIKTVSILTLLGVLFSGYLSSKKLFTSSCAFGETCPLFLGHPACYYGFGLFLIMCVTAVLGYVRVVKIKSAKTILAVVSCIGIIFAGSLSLPELSAVTSGASYNLILPTCVYGLVFYILIFVLSLLRLKEDEANRIG